MKILFKRLHENAVIPQYQSEFAAAVDLVATEITTTPQYIQYHTGLAVEIPEGYVGIIAPRSSISNKDLLLANSVGIIDSDYRGELLLRFKSVSTNHYAVGERVGQFMVLPCPRMEIAEAAELTDTSRGVGGFGSTNT